MSRASLLTATARPLKALFVSDAFEGILLITVAVLAIVAANSPLGESYHHLFHGTLAWSPIAQLHNLHAWINDALMAVFFFVVGLEVKREIIAGNLADARSRRLPVLAAMAGMAAPALVYFTLAGAEPVLERGWAIPAATDIAFAMGVIGLLGSRVPAPLRLFLLTVAIVDDIGAVLIIALFYTAEIQVEWLLASVLVLAVMIGLNRGGVSRAWPYVLAALVLWFCVLNSGVHATIAGVVAALTIPMGGPNRQKEGTGLLEVFEHGLVRWNAYLIVPLFGFANAGVALGGLGMEALFDPLPLAIAAGLVIGKQVGIFASIVVADRLGFAARPENASWTQIWGMSVLCGIGFTMSLFIGALAFPDYPLLIEEAKLGVLVGSLISAVLGYAILRFAAPVAPAAPLAARR
jgi:NhaA family Na+:H+ antiporter